MLDYTTDPHAIKSSDHMIAFHSFDPSSILEEYVCHYRVKAKKESKVTCT